MPRFFARPNLARRSLTSRTLLAVSCLLVNSCGGSVTEPTPNPVPVLLTVSPAPVVPGPTGSTVTLSGSGFIAASRARWNDGDRVTRFISESSLEVDLTFADLNGTGTGRVSVFNGGPGGGGSGTMTVAIGAPSPTLASLSATKAKVGDPTMELVLTGSGFVSGSTVRFGTDALATTWVSYTQLKATIPAAQLQTGRLVPVSVNNPLISGSGGVSGTVDFAIENPVPTATSVTPDSVETATLATVTVLGTGFVAGTVIRVNGADRATTVVDATHATVTIPATDLMTAGTLSLTAFSPAPGGGVSSPVTLRAWDAPPRITALAPASVVAGQGDLTLTVTGTGFTPSSVIQWNGQARATQFVRATTLTATIAAADVASPSTAQVTVLNPGASGVSNAVALPAVVGLVAPTVVSLTHKDLAFDATRNVFYASVPSTHATLGNTVTKVGIDGKILGSVSVGSEPTRLAMSDDGQFLYVVMSGSPTVVRVALATFTKDIEFQLGGGLFGALYGEDIVVLPGLPHTVAVSRRNSCCSPRHEGVALYDDGVMRTQTTQGHTGSDRIARAPAADLLYGYNNETTEFGFRRITVSATGLQESTVRGGLIDGFGVDIEQDGNRIYATNGAVVDPVAMTRIGTIAASGTVRPDVAHTRVHFLNGADIRTFSSADFTLVGTSSNTLFANHTTMIRWGVDGLALGGGETIVITRGSLVAP